MLWPQPQFHPFLCPSLSQELPPHWTLFSIRFPLIKKGKKGSVTALFSKELCCIFWPFGSLRIQTGLVSRFWDGRRWAPYSWGLIRKPATGGHVCYPCHRYPLCSVLFFGHLLPLPPPVFPSVVLCFERISWNLDWTWTCYSPGVLPSPLQCWITEVCRAYCAKTNPQAN